MGDFGTAERRILEFMSKGTEFIFNGKGYTVMLSGKPTCHKGEPKTDIYILADSCEDEVEIKISYKKEIKLGETVKCKYSFVNNTHVICVKSEDDTKLHSVIEFLES